MKAFLRNVLATIVGLFLFIFLGVFFLGAIISSATKEKEVKLSSNSVLHLRLNGPILERSLDDPFADAGFFPGQTTGVGLVEIKEALREAANDSNIEGIYLECSGIMAGFASLEEIRNALIEFKESGKFIYTYGEYFSEGSYYLASLADKIFLNPQGLVEFNGLNVEITFIKGTLEKLEVQPEIFRVGDFKSAIEPLVRKDMSEDNRKQTESYINSIYDHYLQQVAASLGREEAELRNISNKMLVRDAETALEYGLVHQIAYYDEVEDALREQIGLDSNEKIKFVRLGRYRKSYKTKSNRGDRIAVIVATGNIVDGDAETGVISSDVFAAEIRKARLDKKVKAIVLRINSPGGSALASDVIWREVILAKEEKPVVASMSDVAASGGYYIAMAADKILAQPNTITGSIGVFGVYFNAKGLLENKLGITTDVVKTGEYSDIMSMTRPLRDGERAIIQNGVDNIYKTFTSKAAEGRGMELDQLVKLAGGRVWSGNEALANGLIDEIGGLDRALELAAELAELEDYGVRYYPTQKTFIEQIMSELNKEVEIRVLKHKFGMFYPFIKDVDELMQLRGYQARLPFDIEIK